MNICESDVAALLIPESFADFFAHFIRFAVKNCRLQSFPGDFETLRLKGIGMYYLF